MGTQKGKLFELAEMYHSYKKQHRQKQPKQDRKAVEVKGKHFDDGKSISLAYSLSMYPERLYESHQRQINAMQMSAWDNDQSEAFYVEPFEAEKTVDVPHKEVSVESYKEAKLDKIVKINHEDEVEEPKPSIQKEETAKGNEKQPDKTVSTKDDTRPSSATDGPQPKEKEAKEKVPDIKPETEKENLESTDKSPVMAPYEASDEEFAKDIGAILKGQKIYDAGKKTTVTPPNTKPQPATPEKSQPAAEDDLLNPDKNKHKIFEQIAKSMQYANSYDLGAIELEQRFDKMEEEIEQEELDKVLRNKAIAQEKDTPGKEIFDVDKPAQKPALLPGEKFNSKTVLTTANGGRLITPDRLEKGDIVLATSASECVAGVFIGNNKILAKGLDGNLEPKEVTDQLSDSKAVVALRHIKMKPDKSQAIEDLLTKLSTGKVPSPKWMNVSCPEVAIHPDVCLSAAAADRDKCTQYTGRIDIGTRDNNSFLCAASIIDAFETNQLGFLSATKEHNGSLKYFGHLKTNA